jgi:hypothetical protein
MAAQQRDGGGGGGGGSLAAAWQPRQLDGGIAAEADWWRWRWQRLGCGTSLAWWWWQQQLLGSSLAAAKYEKKTRKSDHSTLIRQSVSENCYGT